jgi:hypothetical protein
VRSDDLEGHHRLLRKQLAGTNNIRVPKQETTMTDAGATGRHHRQRCQSRNQTMLRMREKGGRPSPVPEQGADGEALVTELQDAQK